MNSSDKASPERAHSNLPNRNRARASGGKFIRTVQGKKTTRMLEIESRLGRTLEEDFREYYVSKGWGQIRLAKRWGIARNTFFYNNPHSGGRSWVEMLGLAARCESSSHSDSPTSPDASCEVCGVNDVGLDDAHWVASQKGGSTASHNILKLCPNCHRKLDRDDPIVIELCRERLLFREVKRLIESNDATPKRLRNWIEAIIHRRQQE